MADNLELSANCLKTCVRYCPQLKLLDIKGRTALTIDDAADIASFFARFGHSPRLIVRSAADIRRDARVEEIQNTVKEGNLGHRSRFVIDRRSDQDGFLKEGDQDDGNTLVYENL